jgi:uncharacterized cupredoxin-like copper-binding protein
MIGNIRIAVAVGAVAAAAGLAACGSSSGGQHHAAAAPPATTATSSAPAAAATPTTQAPPPPNTATVVAYDKPTMRYAVSGSPQAGLITFTYRNAGDAAHEMTLAKLKAGVTLAQVKLALHQADPDKAAGALLEDPDGEITGPAILGPGRQEKVSVRLDAGHYLIVCFLPGAHGMPHALMGMVGELTVGAGPSAAQPPVTAGTVALTDSHIQLPARFSRGGTFAVTNKGTKPHDFSVARLKHGSLPAYFQCVAGSFGKGTPIDRCPGALAGGVTTIPPGQTGYLTLAPLAAGRYGYVSTQGDGADFKAGLNGTLTVH